MLRLHTRGAARCCAARQVGQAARSHLCHVIHVHVIEAGKRLARAPVPEMHVALAACHHQVVGHSEAKQLLALDPEAVGSAGLGWGQ